jgi:hypothetical protein
VRREIAVGSVGILTAGSWNENEMWRRGGRLDAIFERHQQWIHVLEALKLGLVDFLDDTFVVGCEVNGLVGEFGWEVGEILSGKIEM